MACTDVTGTNMLECQYGGTILVLQHIGAVYWYQYGGAPSLQCHIDVISTLHAGSFVIYSHWPKKVVTLEQVNYHVIALP